MGMDSYLQNILKGYSGEEHPDQPIGDEPLLDKIRGKN